MKYRPICNICHKNPVAVNYLSKDGVTHYRTLCDTCKRKGRGVKPPVPSWVKGGYKKKPHCEKCGFKAKYTDQLVVYHIDGNLGNNGHGNLKTICCNCQVEIAKEGLGWKQGALIPDN